MSDSVKSVRGMNDVIPAESAKWRYFEGACIDVFSRFGYQEIRTPILESTALFSRGIGEATDIVEKEMYTFETRGGNSVTMRPEMTASSVRAYIEHSVSRREPVTRWFYSGPAFRYERMQRGRYRQFYQMGVEAFGAAEATVEAEQIAMIRQLYEKIGIERARVHINSVGNAGDRPLYRKALVDYLTPSNDKLCPDCQRRLAQNPLRILDCKVKSCRAIAADAPSILDHLGDESRAHFDAVRAALDSLGVTYVVDPKMVRGLDYYTGTVFELVSEDDTLGSQSTLAAGGRYDRLVESLGGPPTPAVGFALGVERAVLTMAGASEDFVPRPALFLASRGDAGKAKTLALAHELRIAGHYIEVDHRKASLKSQYKRADKLRSMRVTTIGDDELTSGLIRVRDMATRDETEVTFEALSDHLTSGNREF